MQERLDRLDKRETELLDKVEQQTNTIKKLKEDRAYYHTKCDEKEYVPLIYSTNIHTMCDEQSEQFTLLTFTISGTAPIYCPTSVTSLHMLE